ncbi:hypothetical protein [Microbulbifer sediminum]|uniref:hypothetical protein n=1 Tax=Microbulbifer sediminum TaxID=2904250 RepID=UPI001F2AEBB7|nr:hypothetical protein [Microbulbifer sediminum]
MKVKDYLQRLALLAVLGVTSQSPVAAEFEDGVKAFRASDYQRALLAFSSLEARGNNSARLKYNIGVTLVKLGRYREAASYFYQLLDDPEWRDLARYNLALTAEKRDRPLLAARHYRKVTETADSEKLRKLASSRLNALAADDRGAIHRQWLGLASLSAGYDNNAYALQNELLADVEMGEDSFTEGFVWGQYRVRGTPADGWRLHGYAFSRRYRELESLNLNSVSAALSRDKHWQGWDTEVGLAGEFIYLGGDQVSRQVNLVSRLTRNLGIGSLSLSYLPGYYLGGEGYEYLDGWRQRVALKWRRPLLAGELLAFYQYDSNDRADLEREAQDYYSYSPARHSLGSELEWPILGRWTLSAGMEFRQSVYDGTNRITRDDGSVISYQRESDRLKSWIETRYRLSPRFSLDGKVVNIDNRENRDIYTFDKTEFSLGVSYVF